jgi:hypothetical protein
VKSSPFMAGCLFVAGVIPSLAVEYSSIDAPGVVVTGVRASNSTNDDVVITASYTAEGVTRGALYSGSLATVTNAPIGSWVPLVPVIGGQTVTSTSLYGPNTAQFTPGIGAGNVIAVGSYKYAESPISPAADHGVIYQGSVSGGGTWTQIDAVSLVTNGTLLNTIAHSTMGSLVVGNYDTSLATGNAFIYNMSNATWTNLAPAPSASVTAYGIWQNSETSFTIAGGLSTPGSGGLDQGYLVNYDITTGQISDFKTYNYNNEPISALVSHFDGITATETGFHLTGDYATIGGETGGFFASVDVLPGGGFGEAEWTRIAFPGADLTSGNTVVEDSVLGIYISGGTALSYVATVPEPGTITLLLLGSGYLLVRGYRRQ